MKNLAHLLQPLKIKSLELSNRVVMPPMGTGLANPDHSVSDATIAYLARRAKGGAGLIITEIVSVHPDGAGGPGVLGAWDDKFIDGMTRLAEAVHAQGSKIAMQFYHCGRESVFQLANRTAVSASAIPSVVLGGMPRELSRDEIKALVADFGHAAARAQKAGFDAVEVHGAHGYLLCQFLSALSNQRTDEYGGDSLRDRSRIVIEVLREIRRRVGDDFPISLRISAEEDIEGGYTIEDMQVVVPDFVDAGADIIHASFGTAGSPAGRIIPPIEYAEGCNVRLARKIKEVVDVPVIAVGRFTSPSLADEVIARGDADLVSFGRQHLADPDFLINAKAGKEEATIQCIACKQGCIERLKFEQRSVRCAINPETGQELIYPRTPAPVSRRVWVIGAGPAGLTAASEAARLGHKVILYEKETETGGQVKFAAKAPYKEAYGEWIQRLSARARRMGVDIRTGTEVTEEILRKGMPEAVILAIGGEKIIPSLEGIDQPHVCDAWQILSGDVMPENDAVVIGGGLTGMEAADFMCAKGCRNVTVIEMLSEAPVSPATSHGYMLHERLKNGGGSLRLGTRLHTIGSDYVTVVANGREELISPIAQVVVAVGVQARDTLKDFIEKKGISCEVVGDAGEPRRIIEATEEGARAAWNLSSLK